MEKIYEDPDFGPVRLVKSTRTRRISLRVHPRRGIVVSMPYLVPYTVALDFFRSKRAWVARVLQRQAAVAETMAGERETFDAEALRKAAKAYLPGRLQYWAERYGFTFAKVFIKHNVSNWGSCSLKGNINLNLNLMLLPSALSDYVLLHELSHLTHPNHGREFHALLDRLCRDGLDRPAAELEKELRGWRIL